MGFLSEQRQVTDFVETADRVDGKEQPARCSRKTQDKLPIAFMAKKLLHRCIGVHARVHLHFMRRVSRIPTYKKRRVDVVSRFQFYRDSKLKSFQPKLSEYLNTK